MLKITQSIKNSTSDDIGDNVLYYYYGVKHILKMIRNGIDRESPEFLVHFQSFSGQVFENFVYEKLLRYAVENDDIKYFIVKGPHRTKKTYALPNTISLDEKGSIVCRTNRNEIGEFDALIFTKQNELYFVEMTLTKSVSSLRKRLRKKKALLEAYFPKLEVKALLILTEGVVGVNALPAHATTWIIKPFDATPTLDYIASTKKRKLKPFEIIKDEKVVGTDVLDIYPFRYYNTLAWILKKSRSNPKKTLDMEFLLREDVVRYHELFTKIYIGYMPIAKFKEMFSDVNTKNATEAVICVEKEHTGNFRVLYFLQYSRKNLDMVTFKNDKTKVEKKDPYGISVNEVLHIRKSMNESESINIQQMNEIIQLLKS
ncbi:MAG: hypothetical protein GQ570_13635 [Helicobacteraceae bacterium]|nr:hypothetical protein [Helicobacteraceae bacterium]